MSCFDACRRLLCAVRACAGLRAMGFRVGLALALAGLAATATGQDLGRIGPTYPIAEENALDMLLRRLHNKQRSGELQRIEQRARQRAVKSIKEPLPVPGLRTVVARSQRHIDPSVRYEQAVTTDEGRIVVPAGARVNPLLITRLSRRLVFFDGRDRAQVQAVQRMVAAEPRGIKPILMAGSWFDLSKAWKTQVYFDQHGSMARRFGIQAVPTVIEQQGAQLLVQEIPAGELR